MKLGIKGRIVLLFLFMLLIFSTLLLLYHLNIITLITALLLAVGGMAVLVYLTITHLINPLEKIISVAYQMAGGILENEIIIDADNEFDELASSINVMGKQLKLQISQMNETRNLSKVILDSMGDGVIALDSNGKILTVNPALERMLNLNLKREQIIGKKLMEVIRHYDLDQLLTMVLTNKEPTMQEIKILLPEPRILRVNATPLKRSGGNTVGVVALFRDVTRYQQLEKMRRDFVANVSHELRTPLTSIKGFSETLLDGALEDEQTARRFLNIMKQEADRLTKLIDDLLKLSRLENKRTILDKEPVDINDIIEQVLFNFKLQAAEKNIKLTKNLSPNLPKISAQKDLLIQVLINLVDNAVKYTPVGGEVSVSSEANKKAVCVSVEDTGPGIPQESLDRVFERFYRVDKARVREAGGTGLGLAIVKHVLELHNGNIKVENTGNGTKFTFSLPVEDQ